MINRNDNVVTLNINLNTTCIGCVMFCSFSYFYNFNLVELKLVMNGDSPYTLLDEDWR